MVPFDTLSAEYAHRWAVMRVTRADAAMSAARSLLSNRGAYDSCQITTGVPSGWLMGTNWRESDGSLATYLGNGDPLHTKTTHVPAGRGPFASWADGAVDALRYDGIDKVTGWTIPRACYEWELWNGFGPRAHGFVTGYVWAGTDQYTTGKYVADGVWSPTTVDQQLGTAAVLWALLQLSPALGAMFNTIDAPATTPTPVLQAPPAGLDATAWVQTALNTLGAAPPLVVDDSYGRETRRAVIAFQTAHGLTPDGYVGPLTRAALEKETQA